MAGEYTIGIDLGTTYSCLAYINEDGETVVEKNFEQEETTPSVILFNENGEIIVGSPAKDMAIMYPPERIVTAIKRQIGTDYEVDVDGDKYTPITLSAAILRKMINDFNDNHGCEIKKAVITCPAYFGQTERDATKAAGKVAGLEDVTIINEPTAAAISFGLGSGTDSKKRVLVYDLGGGTFDVTILEIDGTSFTAVATDGERLLGGKDWDAAITKIIKQKVCEDNGIDQDELDADDDVRQTLVLDSETIKKRLSTAESTKGTLTAAGKKAVYSISRSEFEIATAPLMQTTLEIIDRTLATKEFTIKDIDEVILVGGSSRMPQVKDGICKKYPEADVKIYDPDQSVAKGAAIFSKSYSWDGSTAAAVAAAAATGTEYVPEEGEILVHNVLSKSFGIKAMYDDGEEKISNIIFRNEVLPIVAIKTYYPVDDGQTSIKVEIYEDSASNNDGGNKTELIDGYGVGDFEMELPEGVTRSTPIMVKFTATDEGILVACVDCLNQHTEYQLQNRLQMSDSDIEESQGLMEKVTNAN
ncbi:MAG: Hsp70 family protein [Candidatus Methanomethylophilaceae archaeon]|nr:Hsp70 family protein [Candidatus Methanomethylophilaceae archaeon]